MIVSLEVLRYFTVLKITEWLGLVVTFAGPEEQGHV